MKAGAGSALNAARRARELEQLAATAEGELDLLVIGLGVTGVGVALDAASRGLSVAAVDAHDLAFGTSRWSSKLVHGGLRYLAKAQFGVAYESAVERGVILQTTAPHLTRALPMLLPGVPSVAPSALAVASAGIRAGDGLRLSARTPRSLLPRPRGLSSTEARSMAPGIRLDGLRGGVLAWDGQLEDDARLVVAIARTAAAHGASILTRVRAVQVGDGEVRLRDEHGKAGELLLRPRVVVNATGVWASEIEPEIALRPARGTHLVFDGERFGHPTTALTLPIPGESNRYMLTLPQPDGRVYVGLTDVDAPGPVPDEPVPSEGEISELLDVLGVLYEDPPGREEIRGAYAGLRPLLDRSDGAGNERTADISRAHVVHRGKGPVVTIVGGKLTTYRRMAEDAVDAALEEAQIEPRECVTRNLPLVGAAPRESLAAVDAPQRLVRRYGTEAPAVLSGDPKLAEPITGELPYTADELHFAVTHEGALDVSDLLDRRTRIGLVADDRKHAVKAAKRALKG